MEAHPQSINPGSVRSMWLWAVPSTSPSCVFLFANGFKGGHFGIQFR